MDDADIYLAALKGDLGPLRDMCALYMEIQLATLGGDLGPLRNKALSGPLNRKARRSIAARERRIAMAEEARKIRDQLGCGRDAAIAEVGERNKKTRGGAWGERSVWRGENELRKQETVLARYKAWAEKPVPRTGSAAIPPSAKK